MGSQSATLMAAIQSCMLLLLLLLLLWQAGWTGGWISIGTRGALQQTGWKRGPGVGTDRQDGPGSGSQP